MSENNKSRRDFLFGRFSKTTKSSENIEKVKMLTPDGQLVEVDRRLVHKTSKPSRNVDILKWMKNASVSKTENEDLP